MPKSSRLAGIPQSSLRYLFFWARNGIYHCLGALGLRPGDGVLVPAYICAAAVQPIEAFGAKVTFYEVGRNCFPDFSDLEAKIDGRTRAVLGVRYFGFPSGIREIRKICDRHGLYLIEDCAHVLQGEDEGKPQGTFGEASVFSWRKFLPVYDGGELILNRWEHELKVDWHREELLFTLRVAKNMLERALPETLGTALAGMRLRQASSPEPAGSSDSVPAPTGRLLQVHPNSNSFDERMVNFPISRVSRVLLKHCLLNRIIAKRRANYSYLLQQVSHLQWVRPLFENLPVGVCPWVCPIFFADMPNGQFPLRKRGIPAASWGGVRPPSISSSEFPSADFLYENLVFLPIHQNLLTSDLDHIIDAVKAVREGGPRP